MSYFDGRVERDWDGDGDGDIRGLGSTRLVCKILCVARDYVGLTLHVRCTASFKRWVTRVMGGNIVDGGRLAEY